MFKPIELSLDQKRFTTNKMISGGKTNVKNHQNQIFFKNIHEQDPREDVLTVVKEILTGNFCKKKFLKYENLMF